MNNYLAICHIYIKGGSNAKWSPDHVARLGLDEINWSCDTYFKQQCHLLSSTCRLSNVTNIYVISFLFRTGIWKHKCKYLFYASVRFLWREISTSISISRSNRVHPLDEHFSLHHLVSQRRYNYISARHACWELIRYGITLILYNLLSSLCHFIFAHCSLGNNCVFVAKPCVVDSSTDCRTCVWRYRMRLFC